MVSLRRVEKAESIWGDVFFPYTDGKRLTSESRGYVQRWRARPRHATPPPTIYLARLQHGLAMYHVQQTRKENTVATCCHWE